MVPRGHIAILGYCYILPGVLRIIMQTGLTRRACTASVQRL